VAHFLSLLLTAVFFLLGLVQPAMAQGSYPTSTEVTIPYPSYEPTKEIRLTTDLQPSEPKFVSSGPLFTSDQFRFAWVCPDGAYLSDNACYTNTRQPGSSQEAPVLTNPTAVQIAFSYDQDGDMNTNGQMIYVTRVDESNIYPMYDSASGEDLGGTNPRRFIISNCPDGSKVTPPNTCAR
jgi:hypothetical protein